MLPERTSILIVGAGPVGLAAAIALHHQGCRDVVIVEAVERNDRICSSRALSVHAATLEALDPIGCAEPLIAVGMKGTLSRVYNQDGFVFEMNYTSSLGGITRFPYALLLSQYSTERVLETQLEEIGLKVQRPYKLVQLNDGEEEGLVATFETGETIKANYVIGADGARSTVRQLTNIGFTDPDGKINEEDTIQMVAADLTFKSPPSLSRDSAHVYTSSNNVFVSIPLPKSPWPESYDHLHDDILRVGFVVPKEDGPPPHSPPPEYVQKYLDKLEWQLVHSMNSTHPVEIDKVLWSTRFRLRAAVADKFSAHFHTAGQEGPCRTVFLIGDAAHIHSPVGGQGMNLGIRDAISLAPVLKKHMELFAQDARTADKMLEEHATLRRARALHTIALTKRSSSVLSFFGSMGWVKYYLASVIKLIFKIPFFGNRIVYAASGLGNR